MDLRKTKVTRSRASRDGRKRHHPANRYQIEKGNISHLSSSAKKIKKLRFETTPKISYRILNFYSVFTMLSDYISCKKCGGDVTFNERSIRGLGFKLVVKCATCDPVLINSCPKINTAYEINRRYIFAMRLLGVGLLGAEKFCAFMDLPRPVFQSFYDSIVDSIKIAAKAVCDLSVSRAAEEEITAIKEKLDNQHIVGISVSRDGSWRKRGFKSLFGIASLNGLHTGKIIDVVMKSLYCKACAQMLPLKGTLEYDEWLSAHSDSCKVNHDGSSGKMEVDGILEMFRRSESVHKVKYVNYIGDGDSKTYKSIVDAKPYGDVCVVKKECINHVQKRMGRRLRALKKSTKSFGGKGQLTDKVIALQFVVM